MSDVPYHIIHACRYAAHGSAHLVARTLVLKKVSGRGIEHRWSDEFGLKSTPPAVACVYCCSSSVMLRACFTTPCTAVLQTLFFFISGHFKQPVRAASCRRCCNHECRRLFSSFFPLRSEKHYFLVVVFSPLRMGAPCFLLSPHTPVFM